jgi:hypothetical protein
MTEHAPDRIWSGIDIPKTIAGVLAAVSAAVVGSYLGVAGTLAGAAVASVIGSVGTEVYHRTINKGKQKLRGTFVTAPAAVGTPPVPAADEEPAPRRQIRWKRIALVAGAFFVLAMGTLTVAEVLSGRSIADATRGGSGDGSTITSIFSDNSGKSERSGNQPAPQVSTSPTGGTETTEPTQPASQQPTAPATETPTAPATGGTTQAPAGDAATADPNDQTG